MADLVRDHVRAREITRGAEPAAQLLEESQIEIHEAILRTVEGTRGRLRHPACRVDHVAEQHDAGRAIPLRHDRLPRALDVLHHGVHEVHFALFGGSGRHRRRSIDRDGLIGGRRVEQRQEVGARQPAEEQQQHQTAESNGHRAATHSEARPTTSVLDVAPIARCPAHDVLRERTHQRRCHLNVRFVIPRARIRGSRT